MTLHVPQELKRAILGIVQRGQGRFSWYQIATRLGSLDVLREPDLLDALKALEQQGLVTRTVDGSRDAWQLTLAGAAYLTPAADRVAEPVA